MCVFYFFFQAEDGIRDFCLSRGLGDVYKRQIINQWLMGQMAYVGPMLGQHHQFHHYNPGKSEFGENRYFKISKRIYKELDERLSLSLIHI